MSQLGARADRPRARPAGQGARVLERQPRVDRARPGARAGGAAPRRPLHRGPRAVHDRHRRARRRRAAGHHAARAPRRGVLLGAPLRSRSTSAAIEPVGEAKPNTEAFRLIAARMGLDDPCFSRHRRGAAGASCSRAAPGQRSTWTRCARAASPRSTSARVRRRTPRAGSGPPTASSRSRTAWLAEAGIDPLPHYDPPAEVADDALAERFPLAMITPKTHLFLNSHVRQPGPPARRPAGAVRGAAPRGRRRRAGWRTARARGCSTTAARSCARRACPTTRGPACWWRRWGGGTPTTRTAPAARPRPPRS